MADHKDPSDTNGNAADGRQQDVGHDRLPSSPFGSPVNDTATTRRLEPPPLARFADSFVHRLHTDGQASHITLAGPIHPPPGSHHHHQPLHPTTSHRAGRPSDPMSGIFNDMAGPSTLSAPHRPLPQDEAASQSNHPAHGSGRAMDSLASSSSAGRPSYLDLSPPKRKSARPNTAPTTTTTTSRPDDIISAQDSDNHLYDDAPEEEEQELEVTSHELGDSIRTGVSTPGSQRGYFDLQKERERDRDRRGQLRVRAPGSGLLSRSKGPTETTRRPSITEGWAAYADGLPTPGSEGRAMGSGYSGDGETLDDDDDSVSWPAQNDDEDLIRDVRDPNFGLVGSSFTQNNTERESSRNGSHPSKHEQDLAIDSPVPRPDSTSTPAVIPSSDNKANLAHSGKLKEQLEHLTIASDLSSSEGTPLANTTRTSTPRNATHQVEQVQDGCISQMMQQFQDVVGQQLDTEGGSAHSSSPSSGSTKLIGYAGSLSGGNQDKLGQKLANERGARLRNFQSPQWHSFMQAYSSGRWDPNRIPVPPKSMFSGGEQVPGSAKSSPGGSFSSNKDMHREATQDLQDYRLAKEGAFGLASLLTQKTAGEREQSAALPNPSGSTSAPITTHIGNPSISRTKTAGELPRVWDVEVSESKTPEQSTDRARSSSSQSPQPAVLQKSQLARTAPGQMSLNKGAATMMLASQAYKHSDFEPFGVPSPERELTDPMSSYEGEQTGKRKGSASSDTTLIKEPTARHRHHLLNSWDPHEDGSSSSRLEGLGTMLSTIAASPATTPFERHPDERPRPSIIESTPPVTSVPRSTAPSLSSSRRSSGSLSGLKRIPPASAPIEWQHPQSPNEPNDYFGDATPSAEPLGGSAAYGETHVFPGQSRSSSSQTITKFSRGMGSTTDQKEGGAGPESDLTGEHSPMDPTHARPISAAGPRRHPSSRHHSYNMDGSFDPAVNPYFASFEAPASLPDAQGHRFAQAQPEQYKLSDEEFFLANGYLRAPVPSNDALRRRALHRFKLLHTAQDINFNRIAHLVKLVFSTNVVLISLVDEDHNWHKVDVGLGTETAERGDSFCSHVILSRNNEPLVVLDTLKDWRFRNHPFVTGGPKIRFYAGAPLRTSEGFNVGSLCIIDSQPRSEFPPRSRMALKEFAAVVVREMELWRDKTRLKARDRIQTSMERFTRECLELDNAAEANPATANASMEKVYESAAKLVCRTLQLTGSMVLDLSQFEPVEITGPDGKPTTVYQADPYDMGSMTSDDEPHMLEHGYGDSNRPFGPLPPWSIMGMAEVHPEAVPGRDHAASSIEHVRLSDFLKKYPEGKTYERVVPSWIRHVLPKGVQFAMIVPIFNIDNNPFAMLCAWTSNKSKQYLEGYELQFLRAIGVIILSAVLKRRMILADKAKSNFISNISHELRTPLHGILAAAELLSDTNLDSNQESFLSTVQACGNSLIETVNHVLDFTKLSGSTKSSIESAIKPGVVDLAHLVEQTVEGCWIGQRARAQQGQSEIGSFYSPPSPGAQVQQDKTQEDKPYVETVIDIGQRERGWVVRCEKGGIRRVLMNLIGNSMKFTRDGYIQVTLRELPHTPGSRVLPVEMAVIDTGKGISKNFLKDQLFQPFSQENPLQTGTGLGLAIVNSIIRSESVNGKVDVWSSEGLGTEIKITLNVELESDESKDPSPASEGTSSRNGHQSTATGLTFGRPYTVSMINFNTSHRGARLNRALIGSYLQWWSFMVLSEESEQLGDVIVTDEEGSILNDLMARNDYDRGVLILSTSRVTRPSQAMSDYQKGGGFVQMVFKPVGPERLQGALRACISALAQTSTPSHANTGSVSSEYFDHIGSPSGPWSPTSEVSWSGSSRPGLNRYSASNAGSVASHHDEPLGRPFFLREGPTSTIQTPSVESPLFRQHAQLMSENAPGTLLRRRSEEERPLRRKLARPSMAPRSTTFQDVQPSIHQVVSRAGQSDTSDDPSVPASPNSSMSTISLTDGGVMLKKAAAPPEVAQTISTRQPRILLVDDNHINLELLSAYLKKKGIEFEKCANGLIGFETFKDAPPGYWDIILMDMSMPVMDGIDSSRNIRKVESDRRIDASITTGEKPVGDKIIQTRCKIFALSGRATSDDKKKAFAAGVDGYLVKPVKLSTLDSIIKRLGY